MKSSLLVLLIALIVSNAGISKVSKKKISKGQRLKKKLEMIVADSRSENADFVKLWEKIDKISPRDNSLTYQSKSQLSIQKNLDLLAAIFAVEAIKKSKKPTSGVMKPSWKILQNVSQSYPIQYLLEEIAALKSMKNLMPPFFENEWNYMRGNSFVRSGNDNDALKSFAKLNVGDRYFLPSQYQAAIILHKNGKTKKALIALDTILNPESLLIAPITDAEKQKLKNYAHLAKGRIYYESKNFALATRNYREVDRMSTQFYPALFEQSWSLFMSGNPQHALGTLHGSNSPFFSNQFNPESKVLEAMIFYWLCRYDDSRNSLADFAENYSDSVEKLRGFIERKRLSHETSYRLFEDLISGVSSESLGIPRQVLQTAAMQDSMLLYRDQYATLLDEKRRVEASVLAGLETYHQKVLDPLNLLQSYLQKQIGKQFLVELRSLQEEFDDLYAQSQFLYLELMMSEKEQLLGRELHADTKVHAVRDKKEIRGWSKTGQTWGRGKDEYWWDEIGFHIVDVKPLCKQ